MYTLTYARDLVVGDVVNFGEREGNIWKVTDLRPNGDFTGYTATYVGVKSRYTPAGQESDGSLRSAGLYRKVS